MVVIRWFGSVSLDVPGVAGAACRWLHLQRTKWTAGPDMQEAPLHTPCHTEP